MVDRLTVQVVSSLIRLRTASTALRFGVGLFYKGLAMTEKNAQEFVVDTSEVDPTIVSELVLLFTDAVLWSEIDPTPEEFMVAIGELMQALMDEMGSDHTLH